MFKIMFKIKTTKGFLPSFDFCLNNSSIFFGFELKQFEQAKLAISKEN